MDNNKLVKGQFKTVEEFMQAADKQGVYDRYIDVCAAAAKTEALKAVLSAGLLSPLETIITIIGHRMFVSVDEYASRRVRYKEGSVVDITAAIENEYHLGNLKVSADTLSQHLFGYTGAVVLVEN